jgi:hypothetical protein
MSACRISASMLVPLMSLIAASKLAAPGQPAACARSLSAVAGAWLAADFSGADLRGSDISAIEPLTVQLTGAIVDVDQAIAIAGAFWLDFRPDEDSRVMKAGAESDRRGLARRDRRRDRAGWVARLARRSRIGRRQRIAGRTRHGWLGDAVAHVASYPHWRTRHAGAQ